MNFSHPFRHRVFNMSIAAASLWLTACDGDRDRPEEESINEPSPGERAEDAAAATGEAVEDISAATAEGVESAVESVAAAVERELDEYNALGLTVRNLLDEDVRGPQGFSGAEIQDLLFDANGEALIVVLGENGLFADRKDVVTLSVDRLSVGLRDNAELALEFDLSADEVDRLANSATYLPSDFAGVSSVDPNLLSVRKILELPVRNPDNEKIADVYDLILNNDWTTDQVVLSRGGVGTFGNRLIAAPWRDFEFAADRGSLQTTAFASEFEELSSFSYEKLADRYAPE